MTPGRPRVICHMATSVDGRIVVTGWPSPGAVRREYERLHAWYEPDAWMCGRITMEPFAGGLRSEHEVTRQTTASNPQDFIAPGEHESFAIAIDPHGRLAWKSNDIDGDHVVAVVSARVSDDYLAMLRERSVSYLIAGDTEVDLRSALDKIGSLLGVRTLMLEGGGRINGGMLRDGLIDELSVLIAPVADGRIGTPALIDGDGEDVVPTGLSLEHVQRLPDDVLWLRYRVS